MTKLLIKGLQARSKHKALLKGVDLHLASGELAVILGPNGAGKTSLLRAILNLTPHTVASASIDQQAMRQMSPRQIARQIAYLPQSRSLAWPNRVLDVVALGRFAHGLPLNRLSATDLEAIRDAMGRCEIEHLAQRRCNTLSGGELARVHFARALAAQTPILFADEPTTALDPRHQLRIMGLMQDYARRGGAVLLVLHDLDLAARFADRLIWMQNGSIIADGPGSETLNPQRLAEVYGIEADIRDGRIIIHRPL